VQPFDRIGVFRRVGKIQGSKMGHVGARHVVGIVKLAAIEAVGRMADASTVTTGVVGIVNGNRGEEVPQKAPPDTVIVPNMLGSRAEK